MGAKLFIERPSGCVAWYQSTTAWSGGISHDARIYFPIQDNGFIYEIGRKPIPAKNKNRPVGNDPPRSRLLLSADYRVTVRQVVEILLHESILGR